MPITVVADENIPGLEVLEQRVRLIRLPGRAISTADVRCADVMLIRSVTRVDETLLGGTKVRFVGSATIGSDHLDLPWLTKHGVEVALAPGCNAQAVAEYVLQAVLRWSREGDRPLAGQVAGILGYGQVGRRVAALLQTLGMEVRVCDPPLRAQGALVPFADFDRQQLSELDVISLHIPLTRVGEHATWHWLPAAQLAALSERQLLINTCRGEVLEDFASVAVAATLVMDVWPQEPWVSEQQLSRVWLGSPHVAGYSLQGKLRGTAMVLEALNAWHQAKTGETLLPREALTVAQQPGEWREPVDSEQGLLALLTSRYDLGADHRTMLELVQHTVSQPARAAAFDRLRKHYPVRHELSGMRLTARGSEPWLSACRLLGVQC